MGFNSSKDFGFGNGAASGGGGGGLTSVSTCNTNTFSFYGDGTIVNPLCGCPTLSSFANQGTIALGDGLWSPNPIRNGLVYGGIVTWLQNYDYSVSAAGYYINGVFYTSPQTTVTLAPSDPTLDRIDLFVVTTSGTATSITGTPANPPQSPTIDPNTELDVSFALVTAGSTAPSVTSQYIYLNNAEWATSVSSPTINPASPNNPFSAPLDVEFTNTPLNANITFTTAPFQILPTYQNLILYIRSKVTFPTNRRLLLTFRNGATTVGAGVIITGNSTTYGFDSTITSAYQRISIPLINFGLSNSSIINNLRIQVAGTGGFGFLNLYIDNIEIQSGTPPPDPQLNLYVPSLGFCSTIRCNVNNSATSQFSSALAGRCNVVNTGSCYSSILSGLSNTINTSNSGVILGGKSNTLSNSAYSFIGGGCLNRSCQNTGLILGGVANVSKSCSVGSILGGTLNYLGNSSPSCSTSSNLNCVIFLGNVASQYSLNDEIYGYNIADSQVINLNVTGSSYSGGYTTVCTTQNLGTSSSILVRNLTTSVASGRNSTIAGGLFNTVSGNYSFIGGGCQNNTSGNQSFTASGIKNTTSGNCSFTGSGSCNTTSGQNSFTAGGLLNTISNNNSFIGNGIANTISGGLSFIGSGTNNTVTGSVSTILNGFNNLISSSSFSQYNTILNGGFNCITSDLATYNTINGQFNIISGCTSCLNLISGIQNIVCSTDTSPTSGTQWNNVFGNFHCINTTGVAQSNSLFGRSHKLLGCNKATNFIVGVCNCITDGGTFTSSNGNLIGGARNIISGTFGVNVLFGDSNIICATSCDNYLYSAILSGQSNKIENPRSSAIVTGQSNCIIFGFGAGTSGRSFIGGGCLNVITCSSSSSITSGRQNVINGSSLNHISITSGCLNTATANNTFIGGGVSNTVSNCVGAILSGCGNIANAIYSTVINGCFNTASGQYAAIVNGDCNLAQASFGFIGNGVCNVVCNSTSSCLALGSVVVGGVGNNTTGGTWDLATCTFTVAPTICNTCQYSFVGGGFQNHARGEGDVVVGGKCNGSIIASNGNNFIGGGFKNNLQQGSGCGFIGGGECNLVGCWSAVAGGCCNCSSGNGAFIGAGSCNINLQGGVIVGGFCNFNGGASGGFIGAGNCNRICFSTDFGSAVVGGSRNLVCCTQFSIIGGGRTNTIFGGGGAGAGDNGIFSGSLNIINNTLGSNSFIGGGCCNSITSICSFSGAGLRNTVSGNSGVIVGGNSNVSSNCFTTIVGGNCNTSSSYFSTIVGGERNLAQGVLSFIGGGECNNVCNVTSGCIAIGSVVVGGIGNNTCGGTWDLATCSFTSAPTVTSSGRYSFIGGGFQNRVGISCNNNIVGGSFNLTSGAVAFIGSGRCNTVSGSFGSIINGNSNTASEYHSSIIGGSSNTSSGRFSLVSGLSNSASGRYSSVITGCINSVGARFSTIVSGNANRIVSDSNGSAILSGYANEIESCCLVPSMIGSGSLNIIGNNVNAFSVYCVNGICLYLCGNQTASFGSAQSVIYYNSIDKIARTDIIASSSFVGGYTELIGCAGTNWGTNGISNGYAINQSVISNGGGGSVISGGFVNNTNSFYSFIGGGYLNNIRNGCSSLGSVVVGGVGNNTTGGTWDLANCCFTIMPTICNAGQYSFIGGGFQNRATGNRSSVLGGQFNDTCGFADAHIVGSCLNATQACTTFVNCLSAANLTCGNLVCVGANSIIVNTNFGFGAFSDTTVQTMANTACEQVITFNCAEITNGVSLVNTQCLQVSETGTYGIDFSLQLIHTSGGDAKASVWVKCNCTDIARSASYITVNGNNSEQLAAVRVLVNMNSNDYLQLYWNATDTDVSLSCVSAGASPTRPVSPSIIANLQRIR